MKATEKIVLYVVIGVVVWLVVSTVLDTTGEVAAGAGEAERLAGWGALLAGAGAASWLVALAAV